MSMGVTAGSGRVMAAINVTPMADIMIVLLIILAASGREARADHG
jgi:biopolymer transport protein ExbD